jgi:hypothetical protein
MYSIDKANGGLHTTPTIACTYAYGLKDASCGPAYPPTHTAAYQPTYTAAYTYCRLSDYTYCRIHSTHTIAYIYTYYPPMHIHTALMYTN